MSVKSFNELGADLQSAIRAALQLQEEIARRKPAPRPAAPVDDEKEELKEMKAEVRHALHTIEQMMVKGRVLQITDLPFSYEMKLEEKKCEAPLSVKVVREGIKAMLDSLGIGLDPDLFMAMIQTVRAHAYNQRRKAPKYRFVCRKQKTAAGAVGGVNYQETPEPERVRAQILEHARQQLQQQRAGGTPSATRGRAAAMGV